MMLNEKAELAKALNMANWMKVLIEMGYTDEQIETLAKEYYGENWKNLLAAE